MKEQGIRFTIVTEEQARTFLTDSTYYFKVKAYAKNFDKYTSGDSAGKYVNLEFAYLQELSTLDARLRKFIIKTTLDIEHFLKVQLLRHVGSNHKEDGYQIVSRFLSSHPDIVDDIERKKNNSNCFDLIEKYHDDFAVWNIVEVLTFRQFIDLYEMYFSFYRYQDSLINCLKPIQFLRNAAAHNNCLINRLHGPYSRTISINLKVENYVATIKDIKATARNKKMENPLVHDLMTMLYVYQKVVTSEATMSHMKRELQDLIDRFARHEAYFKNNSLILSYFDFFKKVVDNF